MYVCTEVGTSYCIFFKRFFIFKKDKSIQHFLTYLTCWSNVGSLEIRSLLLLLLQLLNLLSN